MNETIVAKGLAKHLTEKFEGWHTDEIIVKNKAQTADHGYTSGCATIIWEGGPTDRYDASWTVDLDRELADWVQAKYGDEYWLEAYSDWMLKVQKGF